MSEQRYRCLGCDETVTVTGTMEWSPQGKQLHLKPDNRAVYTEMVEHSKTGPGHVFVFVPD